MKRLSGFLAIYQQLLAEIDAWFAACLRTAPDRIVCRAGCSDCCRGLFDITLLDAFVLKTAFDRLPEMTRRPVVAAAEERLADLRRDWPEFRSPFLLNGLPDALWTEMPEDDPTPCPLLGADGRCLVYAARPMTCRLHGLPNIDLGGESFSDACCSLNFVDADPLAEPRPALAISRCLRPGDRTLPFLLPAAHGTRMAGTRHLNTDRPAHRFHCR